ncbi:alpha-1,2-mannosyltransferase [Capronia coronata CBS 617.96]|uniref:Mannosyltransferase n=1 Tax=Capronia coronata CBS 617.96 TaxID=1182541 RepID=W9Y633_9EURO|nr:alpha-1,2-mannosyltransferase [Capronia coronata CBS 617.96]EXJ87988.1 alpha-1,2-mannosyltransferase [Capronia coronata CBS 617.96]
MDPSLEDFNRRTDPIRLPEGSKPQPSPRPATIRFYLPLNMALYTCFSSHLLAALYAPIQDCDETFNYWEPLHYLTHGYGLQTWEYSPAYGIRSWAYIAIHALPTKVASLLGQSKTAEFYALRIILAFVSAATEVRLYSAISRTVNPRVGVIYLMIVAITPGFFYASSAFLPSSFAMYTSTLGLTCFMDWHSGPRTATGIMWFGIGALLGWPFAGALILPFVAEDWLIALVGQVDLFGTFRRYLDGFVRCLIVLALQVSIDTFFYRKVLVVPWRIVAYNVFGGQGRGPNIFGTEPWDYYVRNLLLNFNIWLILALLSGPLLLSQWLFMKQHSTKQTLLRTLIFLTPFYLWLAIFTVQPHKEERFMFPAYPFLALNAAMAFHSLLLWIGSPDSNIFGRIPVKLKLVTVLSTIFVAVNIGLLRIFGTVSAYRAPLQIYEALETSTNMTQSGDTVCFGKDWYRFPSSHFLPDDVHAKFIKSEFDGLLPGEFHEGNAGFGFFQGTWLVPSGMNDQNREDLGKYTDVNHCTYLVDTYMPGMEATEHEPLYVLDNSWEKISCAPFLDTSRTGLVARTIWVPDLAFIPVRYRRQWGEHCLLRRKTA